MHIRHRIVAVLFLLTIGSSALATDTAVEAYKVLGIRPADVLTGTTLTAQVRPGGFKQVICVTTFFTGKREAEDAVDVRLDILDRRGDQLVPIYSRDFGVEAGGAVGDGDLQVVDLDMDGMQDVIVSFKSYGDPLIDQRLGEVIVHGDGEFRTAWSGPLEYDATRAARNVPAERRDRFERELDLANTLRTRGLTLFFNKTVIAVAGERLAQPKVVQETFALRAANSD